MKSWSRIFRPKLAKFNMHASAILIVAYHLSPNGFSIRILWCKAIQIQHGSLVILVVGYYVTVTTSWFLHLFVVH